MTTPLLNASLFYREDESLKQFLSGLTVTDEHAPNGRPVPVYFRMPEIELRKRAFPYLLIDPLGPVIESDREMRGANLPLPPHYLPDGLAAGAAGFYTEPIPLQLRYAVSSNTRFRSHDLQLTQKLMVLLIRFGAMNTVATVANPVVPAIRDDTSDRRVDLLSGPVQADTGDDTDPRKRTFRRVWTLGVSSEIFLDDISVAAPVQQVVIDPATRPGYQS